MAGVPPKKDGLSNYKFEVEIDGFKKVGFNEVSSPHKHREGIRTFRSEPFSAPDLGSVTFERKVEAGSDFYNWVQEAMALGDVDRAMGRGGMDSKIKDRYGQDIDFQVWRKWVPRWLSWLLRTRVLRWLFNWKTKWFLKSRTTFKNAYPIRYETVPGESDSDVSVSEMTVKFE